ncbi:MAG: GntR family transcriptional regulator [Planctomycetota bacterium]
MKAQSRPNLSGDLSAELRGLIVDGQLAADSRLNEVHLAEMLGVSRTPLREALMGLAAEGFVTSIPRRGFFVTSLTLDEFEQLYGMRAVLDPAALELSGLPDQRQMVRLESLNREIEKAQQPAEVLALDNRWHLVLLEHCPNKIMIDLITHFMRRTSRYELAYMREAKNVGVAVEEHEIILDACRRGDHPGACSALRQNMQSCDGPLTEWLTAQAAKPSGGQP